MLRLLYCVWRLSPYIVYILLRKLLTPPNCYFRVHLSRLRKPNSSKLWIPFGKSMTGFKMGRMIHGCASLTRSTIAPFFIISLDTEDNSGHAERPFASALTWVHSINHSKAKCRCRFDRKCQSHNQCIRYRREACIIYSTEEDKMKLCRRKWNLATEGVQLTV
jgi:hypothetical protein